MQSRRTGLALLGRPDDEGELVSFNLVLELDGEDMVSFTGTVTSVSGSSLGHLYGRDLILEIHGGPALGVTIAHFNQDNAVVQLTPF